MGTGRAKLGGGGVQEAQRPRPALLNPRCEGQVDLNPRLGTKLDTGKQVSVKKAVDSNRF